MILTEQPNATVLLTANTHSAVDNMIAAVKSNLVSENVPVLRLRVSHPNENLELWDKARIIGNSSFKSNHESLIQLHCRFNNTWIESSLFYMEKRGI